MSGSPENDVQSPLLRPRQEDPQSSRQAPSLVLLLGRVAGRRGASMLVRETAARELEERRADWGYSKPLVCLDVLWNLALVVAAVAMLIATTDERPNTLLRLWIFVYALQCLVHAVLVWVEFRRRSSARERGGDGRVDGTGGGHVDSDTLWSLTKRCEWFNTMASFVWWIVGFYWVVSGGEVLLTAAPRLYWLAVLFLAFDVFFAVFCIVSACLIGIALCCCLPCIIAILYAVAGQEGASEADLIMLPKYRFQKVNGEEKPSVQAGKMVPIETSGHLSVEHILLHEDAECCICLSSYEDGAELHALPCNHHFHSNCIAKWLKMNATCPLCKYNILLGNDYV